MTNKVKDIIEELSTTNDNDELYSYLIDIGKKYKLSPEEKQDIKNIIEKFLTHKDEQIRSAAIRVLGFYWSLNEYKQIALNMFLEDPDEGTKVDALMTWTNLHKKSNNKQALNFLYAILINKKEPIAIKDQAYSGIFVISPLEPKDWPNVDIDWQNFNNDIDWKVLESILKDANE